MKAEVAKLLPTLRQETSAALEVAAAELLDLDRVRLAMFKAARSGLWGMRMRLPDGLPVRQTEAARKLDKWAKAEGLRLEWQSRTADMPDGRRVEVQEPEFSWEPTNHDSRKA
jgi:hypothetical protein